MNKTAFLLVTLATLFFTVIGCQQVSTESNIVAKSVVVSELLSNPDSYKGQPVVLVGTIEYVCPSDG